jgi:hypothetical protein
MNVLMRFIIVAGALLVSFGVVVCTLQSTSGAFSSDGFLPTVLGIGTTRQFLMQGEDTDPEERHQKKIVIVKRVVNGINTMVITKQKITHKEVHAFHNKGGISLCLNLDGGAMGDDGIKEADRSKLIDISPRYRILVDYELKNSFNKDYFLTRKVHLFSKKPVAQAKTHLSLCSTLKQDPEALWHGTCAVICALLYGGTVYIPYGEKSEPNAYGHFMPEYILSGMQYQQIARALFVDVSTEAAADLLFLRQAQLDAMRKLAQRLRDPEQIHFSGQHAFMARALRALLVRPHGRGAAVSDTRIGAGVGDREAVVAAEVSKEDVLVRGTSFLADFSPHSAASSATVSATASPESGPAEGGFDDNFSLASPLLSPQQRAAAVASSRADVVAPAHPYLPGYVVLKD